MARTSSGAAIKAGEAVVLFGADVSALQMALRSTEGYLSAWGQRIQRLGRTLASAGIAGAALFIKPIREAANVEQLLGRFDAVFAEFATNAGSYADDLAKKINQSGLTLRDQLAQFNAYLKGIGFDPAQANQLSQQLTAWSNDWIAFDDTIVNGQEAVDLFLSALSGEVRPARRMGADLRVMSLDAEAAAKGLGGASEKLTEMQRVGLRLDILGRALGRSGVLGQAQREVATLAAQFRGIKAALRDFSVAVGNAIIVPFTAVVDATKNAVREFEALVKLNPKMVESFARLSIETAGLGIALVGVGKALSAIKLGSFLSQLAAFSAKSPILLVADGFLALTAAVVATQNSGDQFKRVFGKVGDTLSSTMRGVKNALFVKNYGDAFKIAMLGAKEALAEFTGNLTGLKFIGVQAVRSIELIASAFNGLKSVLSIVVSLLNKVTLGLSPSDSDLGGYLEAKALAAEAERELLESEAKLERMKKEKRQKEVEKQLEETYGPRRKMFERDLAAMKRAAEKGEDKADRAARIDFNIEQSKKPMWLDKREIMKAYRALFLLGPFSPDTRDQLAKPFWLLRDAAEEAWKAVEPFVEFFTKNRMTDAGVDAAVADILKNTAPITKEFSSRGGFSAIGATANMLQFGEGLSVQEEIRDELRTINGNTGLTNWLIGNGEAMLPIAPF